MRSLGSEIWLILKDAFTAFFAGEALSHGAAMAFYAVTALAPIILIVLAIAGLGFGHEAAELALSAQITGLAGPRSADLLKATIQGAADTSSGTWATIVGLLTLLVTASGVFGEMQSALNSIWKVPPPSFSVSRLIRARAASLGLVAALGFLLLVSLIASAAITALGDYLNSILPLGEIVLSLVNWIISFILIAILFAAIYKVLPDRALEWRDVIVGAVVTTALFTIGKSLIGWYIGASDTSSSYGPASGLFALLLWVFYSSQIFLFGAELTRAYSIRHGSRQPLAAPIERTAIVKPLPEKSGLSDRAVIGLVGLVLVTSFLAARF